MSSIQKLERTCERLPGTKRVLVRPKVTAEIVDQLGSEVCTAIELRRTF